MARSRRSSSADYETPSTDLSARALRARQRANVARMLEFDPPAVPRPANPEQADEIRLRRSVSTQTGHYPIRRSAGPSQMKRKVKAWDNSSQHPKFYGRGDYKTTLRNIGRSLVTAVKEAVPKGTFKKYGGIGGGMAGTYLSGGNALAGQVGEGLGSYAGDRFSQLVGFGDYQIKANSLMDLPMGQQVASFGNMSNATIVKHREFIRDIVIPASPETFVNNLIQVNPGLRSVFPWLSSIAGNYQEYQFIGCVFEFRSTCSDSATTLPLGSIIMASNYDVSDPMYPDKRHMENSQFCVSGKPSLGLIHPIECDPHLSFSPIKYVRSAALDAGLDHKLFDHVNLMVATEGLPALATGNIGELWVSYEIALYKPNLGVAPALRDHFFGTTATVGAINNLHPFGITPTALSPRGGDFGGLGVRIAPGGNIVLPLGLPPGRYEISVSWLGVAGLGLAAPTWSSASAAVVLFSGYYAGGTLAQIGTTANDVPPSLRVESSVVIELKNPLNEATNLLMTVSFDAGPDSYDLQIAALPTGQT